MFIHLVWFVSGWGILINHYNDKLLAGKSQRYSSLNVFFIVIVGWVSIHSRVHPAKLLLFSRLVQIQTFRPTLEDNYQNEP
jgi:predicted membrane channel-forming protein YqfA (hemolysin III family)